MKNVSKSSDEMGLEIRGLKEMFAEKFGRSAEFLIKVPGRVNLIGEHVDYCGYSVCPMAIAKRIVVLGAVATDDTIRVSHVENGYEECVVDLTSDLPIEGGKWSNYVLCGLKGVADRVKLPALKLLIWGNIPQGAGLSSSSALVCAGVYAAVFATDLQLSRDDMAELAAKAERFVGTQGGGMDQAVIFGAKAGAAAKISFNPLVARHMKLPGKFVVAESTATKRKSESNDFNVRVVECRLGTALMAKRAGLQDWRELTVLADMQAKMGCDLKTMSTILENSLHPGCYERREICEMLNASDEELIRRYLTPNTAELTRFKLRDRLTHVLEEAYRVEEFYRICCSSQREKEEEAARGNGNEIENGASVETGNTSSFTLSTNAQPDCLRELGRLMNDSHASLKNLYECSHALLDELVDVCIRSGALGARLTGAGWGGCVVALIPNDVSPETFVESVKNGFYRWKVDDEVKVDELIFVTEPQDGAVLIKL